MSIQQKVIERTFPGKKGMGNTGTSSKHNNTEIWTFTRAHFCLLCNIPFYKKYGGNIWRGYHYVGNLVYSLKSNLIASK